MNHSILHGFMAAVCMAFAPTAQAAEPETPIIEFHTNIYETYGATNAFHISLGAKEDIYVDIDCGFGTFEAEVGPAVFDLDSQSIIATSISCTVSEEGMIRIYGDASKIDYLHCEGCYIDRISFPELTELQILDLSHNELKALDLSHLSKLESLTLTDNPFDEKPLVIGGNKPNLTILEMSIIGHLDQSFNLSDYPSMASFEAYQCNELYTLDPTGCPNLLRLSADITPLKSIDVSKNTSLLILNISDTYITSVDVSHNPYLTEFYCGHAGSFASSYKIKEIDVTKNTQLQRFYCENNALTTLDISKNTALVSFSCASNNLPSIGFSQNPDLKSVNIKNNCMNFNTMPLPRPMMSEYYYDQKPLTVNRSYTEGSTIDFTARVIRDDSPTDAVIYTVKEESGSVELLDPKYYTWDNGKITVHEACEDSLYVAFKNELFPETILTSGRFMVKSSENFGKPSATVSLRVSSQSKNLAFGVGMQDASIENSKTFYVDFGNGELKEFTATTSDIPLSNNVEGLREGINVTIYMPEGECITALAMTGIRLLGDNDFSKAPTLRELKINNCSLNSIDLKWNRCLKVLDLAYNNLSSVDLSGINGNYGKNVLENIYLSNNRISEIALNDGPTIINLDLSFNQLTTIPLERNTNMKSLNVCGNILNEIDLSDCEALESLDISYNLFSSFALPPTISLKKLNVVGNMLYFDELPLPGDIPQYSYAPQENVLLPLKAPVVDLRALQFEGKTEYAWFHADGTPATSSEVTANNGSFRFSGADAGSFYCIMTNSLFPDFTGEDAYTTSVVEAADMPTVSFMEFTTTENGEGSISLTGIADNTTVYIDWSGDGNLTQYVLKKNYTTFPVETTAGANVKAYAYDENNGVTMCSISGIKMSSLNASALKQASAFFIYDSGLRDGTFILPENSDLQELSINGAELSSINLSEYKKLKSLSLNNNKIENLDLSLLPLLESFYAAGNGMNNIKLDNPYMWELNLNDNNLEEIDLAGAPALSQLWLTGNKFKSINVDFLSDLKVLSISNNYFTFATLPTVKDSYYIYDYGMQKPLEISIDANNKVDLSSQANVNDVATVYTWYIDSPYYDEYGELYGENLIEGEEYTIENGVTTFLANFHNIMCVMTNAKFPALPLYTNFINVTGVSGIDDIETSFKPSVRAEGDCIIVSAENDSSVEIYAINGICMKKTIGSATFTGLKAGIYIVTIDNQPFKVAVR